MTEILRGGRPKEQVDESRKKRPPETEKPVEKPARKRLFQPKQS